MIDDNTSQTRHDSNPIQRLIAYISFLDGNHTWEEVRVAAENLVHSNFAITTKTLTLDRQGWLSFVEHFVAARGTVEIKQLMYSNPEKIVYEIDVFNKDGSIVHVSSLASFRDGKLFRVQPFNPDSYDKVFTSGAVDQDNSDKVKEEVHNEVFRVGKAEGNKEGEDDTKKVVHKSSSFFLRDRFKIKDKKIMPLYW